MKALASADVLSSFNGTARDAVTSFNGTALRVSRQHLGRCALIGLVWAARKAAGQ